MRDLSRLGYSEWLASQGDSDLLARHEVARVTAVHKDRYTVSTGAEAVHAELSGHLLYASDSALALPTTGDWVYVDFYDDGAHAIIHGVLPRKSLLKRKAAGRLIDIQLVAANVDCAFIMQSLNENFNLRRLERYLVMVHESGIEPIILLSKCDLVSTIEAEAMQAAVADIAPTTRVLAFSHFQQDSLDAVFATLESGLTYCLLGSSGVGKTTLLNSLLGEQQFDTGAVSKIQSKGRHTTTTRQLVCLPNGALLVDTPGMRELGNIASEQALDDTFAEIPALLQSCRFANCTHNHEKGCAIQAALASGELSAERYQNYLKMKKESDFNQLSYHEKRQKDKQFGKQVKAALKTKKR